VNVVMNNPAMRKGRARVCEGLEGEVLEIGFGSGHNIPFYPPTVTRVRGVEPSALAVRLAADRMRASTVPIEVVGLDGQRLDLPDQEVDHVLSTWTLCTIPDVEAALREVRRVLKPDGTFHFVEHGRAPDERVRRWQRRLEPAQKALAGGCHLTRPITELVEAAGLEIIDVGAGYQKGTPRPWGFEYLGRARPV
jgi:ubiquinone/menaquinone biosynthesis C-methylase UbiE